VSTTAKPVTQTAEVEVNNATMGSFQLPLPVEKGMVKRIVPKRMTAINPKQIVRATVINN
jgi:hypothetical protein